MPKHNRVALIVVLAWAWPDSSVLRAEVNLVQAKDGSVTVQTPDYTAKIDSRGNLQEVTVKGGKAFRHQFGKPDGSPAAKITVADRTVAVRSGKARVEYTFAKDRIKVATEGYNFECEPDDTVKAVIVLGGKGGAYSRECVYPGSSALVLSNDRMVAFSIPFHVSWKRLVPTAYCNGSLQPGSLLEYEVRLGAPVNPTQLISQITVTPVGSSYGTLREGGNQGFGLVHFPDRQKIVFETAQSNLSSEAFELEYRLAVRDHYVCGKEVVRLKRHVPLAAGSADRTEWKLPPLSPGFYYLTVSAWRRDTKLTDSNQTFTVDLPNYAPALTRPADFKEFWDRQDRKLGASPANPALKLISAGANPDRAYELTLSMPDGSKLRGYLAVPAKPSRDSVLGSMVGSAVDSLLDKARSPAFKLKEDTIVLVLALPDDARYIRWNSAEDNNFLQCVVCFLRGVDYLASRPDVAPRRMMLVGASRSGPLVFITAARRPGQVFGVDAHVHTSAGLSWEDKPYQGWGVPAGHDPCNPEALRRLARMAAYLDPVNHAPDVHVPVIFAYGVDDPLSPPQGIEAMYRHTASRWKRISRDEGGHQFSPGFRQLQQDLQGLRKERAVESR